MYFLLVISLFFCSAFSCASQRKLTVRDFAPLCEIRYGVDYRTAIDSWIKQKQIDHDLWQREHKITEKFNTFVARELLDTCKDLGQSFESKLNTDVSVVQMLEDFRSSIDVSPEVFQRFYLKRNIRLRSKEDRIKLETQVLRAYEQSCPNSVLRDQRYGCLLVRMQRASSLEQALVVAYEFIGVNDQTFFRDYLGSAFSLPFVWKIN